MHANGQNEELDVLAARIRDLHQQVESGIRTTLDHAVELGGLLTRAKSQAGRGGWLTWIENQCEFSARTAQCYMRLHRRSLEGGNAQPVAHLGVKEALEALVDRAEDRILEFHSIADPIPPMTPEEFEELKESIRATGLLSPITLFQGMILDGRERYKACLEVSVRPRFNKFRGDERAAAAFVISLNVMRQHLTPDQKKAYIAELERIKAV